MLGAHQNGGQLCSVFRIGLLVHFSVLGTTTKTTTSVVLATTSTNLSSARKNIAVE